MDDKKISEEKNSEDEFLADNEEKIAKDEILSDEQLDNVAGGTGSGAVIGTGHG